MLHSSQPSRHPKIWAAFVLVMVFSAGLGVGLWTANHPSTPPTETAEKCPPHTSCPNEDGTNKEEPAEESYWNKVRTADILPVWLGVFITFGASVIALVALSDLRKQGAMLKRQNDMIISKERARLRFDLVRFTGEPEEDFPATVVRAEVSIFGSSLASIRETKFFAVLGSEPGIDEPILWWPPIHGVPKVIRPNSEPIETSTILHRTVAMLLGDEGLEE